MTNIGIRVDNLGKQYPSTGSPRLRSGQAGQALRPFDWAQDKLGSGQALRQAQDSFSIRRKNFGCQGAGGVGMGTRGEAGGRFAGDVGLV
jgi:hypothetical protein